MADLFSPTVICGIDVGGTNTDAVFYSREERRILGSAKTPTTRDVTSGILTAVRLARDDLILTEASGDDTVEIPVKCMSIGTTAFINAVLERSSKLAKVGVLRLCGVSTKAILPFETVPSSLRQVIEGHWVCVSGGFEFTGVPISEVVEEEIRRECRAMFNKGIFNVVVSGVFSPIDASQELEVKRIVEEEYQVLCANAPSQARASITLSSEVGALGLIERENASILNESLRPLAKFTIKGFREAFAQLQFGEDHSECPFFLTQNDGTLISSSRAMKFPIFCISSGPTNSARGASFLTGLEEAIVVDIGGTTSDIGVLAKGFPRQTQVHVKIGGVLTNFRMPDVYSIALGGGSMVVFSDGDGDAVSVKVGPKSVGFKLEESSRVFGGDVLTTTDIAVLLRGTTAALADVGDSEHIDALRAEIPQHVSETISNKIVELLEDGIDMMRSSAEDATPIILVGGGTVLLDRENSSYVIPEHASVANALGAAIASASAGIDVLVSMRKEREKRVEEEEGEGEGEDGFDDIREEVLSRLREEVIAKCVANGAAEASVKIVLEQEFEIPYVGHMTGQKRVIMRSIGDIETFVASTEEILLDETILEDPALEEGGQDEEMEEDLDGTFRISSDYSPNFVNGIWTPNLVDLQMISIGAGILGSGGGGSTFIGEILCAKSLGKIQIIPISKMDPNSLAAPIMMMGTPSVAMEKVPNGEECLGALTACEEETGQRVGAVLCGEIGGLNSTIPLHVGAVRNLPVLDCDWMARAFPELQMLIPYIKGCEKFSPTILSNEKGETVVRNESTCMKDIEDALRSVIFDRFGGVGGVMFPPMNSEDVEKYVVQNSYSACWRIGRSVMLARCQNRNPVEALLESVTGSQLVFQGKITHVQSEKVGGFDRVVMRIKGTDEFAASEDELEIYAKNENLHARLGERTVACVPDIITLLNPDDGAPIQTGEPQFGLRCAVMVIPIVEEFRSEIALQVVGPGAFGLSDVIYVPCGPPHPPHMSLYEEFAEEVERSKD